jgi:hypothetical protein
MSKRMNSKGIKSAIIHSNIIILPLFTVFIHGMVPWTSITIPIGTTISYIPTVKTHQLQKSITPPIMVGSS